MEDMFSWPRMTKAVIVGSHWLFWYSSHGKTYSQLTKCFRIVWPRKLTWERSPWVVRRIGCNWNQIHLLHCCRDSSCFRTFRNWLCISLLMKSPLMNMFLKIPLRMLTILWISEIWGGRTQDFAEWHIKLLLCIVVGLGKVYVGLVHPEP